MLTTKDYEHHYKDTLICSRSESQFLKKVFVTFLDNLHHEKCRRDRIYSYLRFKPQGGYKSRCCSIRSLL